MIILHKKLQAALDSIKAEQALIDQTKGILRQRIQNNTSIHKKSTPLFRICLAFCCAMLIFFSSWGYFTYTKEVAYISLDINPSIEFSLNTFDRVIQAQAYNDDGQNIISSLPLKHIKYDEAIALCIEEEADNGYLLNDAFISFTIQSNNKEKEKYLWKNMQNFEKKQVMAQYANIQTECHVISEDLRQAAHSHGISFGKYNAILRLQKVDPSATLENYQHCSMRTIHDQIATCQQEGNKQGVGKRHEHGKKHHQDQSS